MYSYVIALVPSLSLRQMLANLFWSLILKDCIKSEEKKRKGVVLCSRPPQKAKVGTFTL